jgi:class 3 adenylate cyclase
MEKIKTIGDAYMAIGCVRASEEAQDHAHRAAEFALDIHDVVTRVSHELDYPLRLRVGLHVGPVIAGVIGKKRPAFDCWGEAVNLASRLENRAEPGGILISEPAYWRLRHLYQTSELSEVELKGIGMSKVFRLTDAALVPAETGFQS